MAITELTLKKLFALSGNECAFPHCGAPIYDSDEDVITGQICHIKAKSENGPRYDPQQTEAERDSYQNLILMCSPHNKIVDDPATRQKYTVEVLTDYKRSHEVRYRNTVVQPALLQQFLAKIREYLPPLPPPSLIRVAVSFLRRKPEAPEDEYGLQLLCSNRTDKVINDFRLEVQVPQGYRLAVFDHPRKTDGRSTIQTNTRVLLQVNSIRPSERLSLRVLLSVSIHRYPISHRDKLRLTVRSGNEQLEATEYELFLFLDGPPKPPTA